MTALRMTDEDVYELDPRGASDPANIFTRYESRSEIASVLAGITEDDIPRLDADTIELLRSRLADLGFTPRGITRGTRDDIRERTFEPEERRLLKLIVSRSKKGPCPYQVLRSEDRLFESEVAKGAFKKRPAPANPSIPAWLNPVIQNRWEHGHHAFVGHKAWSRWGGGVSRRLRELLTAPDPAALAAVKASHKIGRRAGPQLIVPLEVLAKFEAF